MNVNDPPRGSEQLAADTLETPSQLSKEDLRKLVAITRSNGVKVTGWWIRGQPGIDVLNGVIQVTPQRVGDVVKELITVGGSRLRYDVFPLGIINPDVIQITLSTPEGGR